MEIRINYIDLEKLKKSSEMEFGFSLISDGPKYLTFKLYDPLFGIQYTPGEHTREFFPGVDYWVRFETYLS